MERIPLHLPRSSATGASAVPDAGAPASPFVIPIQELPDQPLRASRSHRLLAGVFAVGCLTVLTIAAQLTPSPQGMGTHTQLGLAPCGFLSATGYPCMSCGMTTAFAHMAHLELLSALRAQPMGVLFYLLAVAVTVLGGYTAVTGHIWASLYVRFYDPNWWYGFLTLWLAAWGYKTLLVRQGLFSAG